MLARPRLWTRLAWLAAAVVGVGVLGGTTAGCATQTEDVASGEDDLARRGGRIELLVTVDWEGDDLREVNLRAMRDLHARFPQVKIVHFLNAAYFTKSEDPDDIARADAKIASALAPGDERGLHVHGWKRLFEAAGVEFRRGPTFWGDALRRDQCIDDCGHEVPLSLYTVSELRKVVRLSLDTLEAHGFGRAKSFRCGGWMAKANVREAVAAEGLRWEQSAVPAVFLAPELRSYPLYGWIDDLWRGTSQVSQPYALSTHAGDLVEVPDNGALADYVTADQMVSVFEANKAEYLRDRRRNVVVSIGFHQETASTYLPRVERALERIFEIAERERIPVESVTSERIGAR